MGLLGGRRVSEEVRMQLPCEAEMKRGEFGVVDEDPHGETQHLKRIQAHARSLQHLALGADHRAAMRRAAAPTRGGRGLHEEAPWEG